MNDPQLAVEFATSALAALPSGSNVSFEAGNEPDLFATHLAYVDADGQSHFMRDKTWSFSQYQEQFSSYAAALESNVAPPPALVGPALATIRPNWIDNLPAFLQAEAPPLNLVVQHNYPYTTCGKKPGDAKYPTIPQLLADSASHGMATSWILATLADANAAGLPYRMTELNSASCGGALGASDTFASALWGADVLFELANAGASGVNVHDSNSAIYDAIAFSPSSGGFDVTVKPLYYGMLLFAQATGNGARLLPVTAQANLNVKLWATIDNAGTINVVALNKDLNSPADIDLTLPGIAADGALALLTAPNVDATAGLSFGGQTFDGTVDGRPLGAYTTTTVRSAGGTYDFALPEASAALLTIGP